MQESLFTRDVLGHSSLTPLTRLQAPRDQYVSGLVLTQHDSRVSQFALVLALEYRRLTPRFLISICVIMSLIDATITR